VTDSWTRKPHIVTRQSTTNAFLKSIKTRYGETLPAVNNAVQITPFETQQRPQWIVSDMKSYARLHATLPGAVLSALKARVKGGEPLAIQELWESKQYTFMAIDFEWSERNKSICLEFGYAAMRCFYLNTARGIWPPKPADDYRRGHFVVEEYANIPQKKRTPVVPWEYAWGDTQAVPKARLAELVQNVFSGLAAPDSETTPNELILVGHGISGDLDRLADLKIKLPRNCICIDTAVFERQMFATGLRGTMVDPNGKARPQGTMLSLAKVIQSFGLSIPCTLHNAGNDAFVCLWALQLLLEGPSKVKTPISRGPVPIGSPIMHEPPIGGLRNFTISLDRPSMKSRSNSLLAVNQIKNQRRTSAPEIDEHGQLRGKRKA